MKFIEVEQFGGPEQLKLKEETTPSPAKGQVLVEVKACGINFADLVAREGHYPPVPSAPFRPGMEVAGKIAELGEDVQGLQVGQRVMALVRGGSYTSHSIVEAQNVVPLPDALDFAPATALLVQGLTAYFLLEVGELQPGDSVLISSAAGGLGSLAVQIAKLKGAGKIIGLASASKHDKVRSFGADEVFDYRQEEWSEKVKEATGGKGVSIYLDSQGDPAGEGKSTVSDGGKWIVYGGQAEGGGNLTPQDFFELIFRNVTIRGYTLYSSMTEVPRALEELIGWAASGRLRIEADWRFPLAEAAKAHEAISRRETSGKVVLEP